jgi:hypothetical protein
MDLMVMEGKWKIDSLLSPTVNIESRLVTKLLRRRIKVSQNGAAFLRDCLWDDMKFVMKVVINVDGNKGLRLNEGSHTAFLATIKKTPHSDQLIKKIGKCIRLIVPQFLMCA